MKEQIELIRKDLNSLYEYRQDNWNYTECHNGIIRHLNAIEEMLFNTLKYKKMWEELYSENEKPCGIEYMQDLEDKYKIEVE
jgi:hypothetical protein